MKKVDKVFIRFFYEHYIDNITTKIILNKSYIDAVVFYSDLLHNNEGIVNHYCADLTFERNSIVSTQTSQTIVYNNIMTMEETSNRK